MASIAVGQTASVRCSLGGTVTVTPGTSGSASVSVQSLDSPSFPARTITAATTFSVVAGDRVSITAINAAATYTDPATTDAALQALVSRDGPGATSRRIVLFGDSQTENNQDLGAFSFPALTQSAGTATLVGVSTQTGQLIKIGRVAEAGYFGTKQITTVGGAATFPVPAGTPTPATSRVRGDGVSAYSGFLVQYMNRNSSRSWMHLANYRAGGELFNVVSNAAYGGDTTWGMLERIDHPDWGVTPHAAEWVSVFGGINDLNAGVPAATIISNLREIYDYLRGRNYSVIAVTLCPVTTGHPSFGDATHAAGILAVNDWIRQYARRQPKMMLWDFFGVINDPTAATLSGLANYVHPTDFIHFTPRACWDLATLILSSCRDMLPGVQNTLPGAITDSRGFSSPGQNQLNPLMQTGTPGVVSNRASGTVATNWAVDHTGNAGSTSTCTVVARTVAEDGDLIGSNQKVVISALAAADSGYIRNTPTNNSTLEVGAWYYVEAAVRVEAWAGLDMPNLSYAMTVDGVTTGATACLSGSSDSYGAQPTGITAAMVMRTPNFYVPTGALAAGYLTLSWRSNAAGSGTLYLGRAHCRKVVV